MRCAGKDGPYSPRGEAHPGVCGGTSHNNVGKYKSLDAIIKSSFPNHPSLFPNPQTQDKREKKKENQNAVMSRSWIILG